MPWYEIACVLAVAAAVVLVVTAACFIFVFISEFFWIRHQKRETRKMLKHRGQSWLLDAEEYAGPRLPETLSSSLPKDPEFDDKHPF